MATSFHYLFDPLCGWCYGAAPALRLLAGTEGLPPLRLHPTGLFAGAGARPMDRAFAAYAWSNDRRIARLTGQTFSEAYRAGVLERTGQHFDSGPATRALTAVHRLAPQREVEALAAVQHARFVDGQDITDTGVLAAVLTGLGLEAAADFAGDPTLDPLVARRIAEAQVLMVQLAAAGVPTLALSTPAGLHPLPGELLFRDTALLLDALHRSFPVQTDAA